MKIIAKDAQNREEISDELVAQTDNEHYALLIKNALNYWEQDSKYYEVVPDDHKLYTYTP